MKTATCTCPASSRHAKKQPEDDFKLAGEGIQHVSCPTCSIWCGEVSALTRKLHPIRKELALPSDLIGACWPQSGPSVVLPSSRPTSAKRTEVLTAPESRMCKRHGSSAFRLSWTSTLPEPLTRHCRRYRRPALEHKGRSSLKSKHCAQRCAALRCHAAMAKMMASRLSALVLVLRSLLSKVHSLPVLP